MTLVSYEEEKIFFSFSPPPPSPVPLSTEESSNEDEIGKWSLANQEESPHQNLTCGPFIFVLPIPVN